MDACGASQGYTFLFRHNPEKHIIAITFLFQIESIDQAVDVIRSGGLDLAARVERVQFKVNHRQGPEIYDEPSFVGLERSFELLGFIRENCAAPNEADLFFSCIFRSILTLDPSSASMSLESLLGRETFATAQDSRGSTEL